MMVVSLSAVLLQPDNDGFSAPVVSRRFVPALARGITTTVALRLAAKHHRGAEPVIIRLKEH